MFRISSQFVSNFFFFEKCILNDIINFGSQILCKGFSLMNQTKIINQSVCHHDNITVIVNILPSPLDWKYFESLSWLLIKLCEHFYCFYCLFMCLLSKKQKLRSNQWFDEIRDKLSLGAINKGPRKKTDCEKKKYLRWWRETIYNNFFNYL